MGGVIAAFLTIGGLILSDWLVTQRYSGSVENRPSYAGNKRDRNSSSSVALFLFAETFAVTFILCITGGFHLATSDF